MIRWIDHTFNSPDVSLDESDHCGNTNSFHMEGLMQYLTSFGSILKIQQKDGFIQLSTNT